MSAIETSQDGAFVFMALEEDITGNQIVFKITRPTSTSPTIAVVYEPGDDSTSGANNVAQTGNPDKMLFHGGYGDDVNTIDHTINTIANVDISPPGLGFDWMQPAQVDPSDSDHIVVINEDDQDALETNDLGANWATLNAALGIFIPAMDLIFLGAYFPFGGFIGGNDGVDENLSYTPNKFANLRDDASAALKAVGNIVSIDIALDT